MEHFGDGAYDRPSKNYKPYDEQRQQCYAILDAL